MSSDLTKVTQAVNGRDSIQSQYAKLKSLVQEFVRKSQMRLPKPGEVSLYFS